MGVRGLTSFIARHAELYMTPYELHDCCLVIDGDNLACNLYRDVTGTYSAFGGDYDDFYRGVRDFFNLLAECNVRALVLMDGGYERRKLRTVAQRMRGKIAVIKRINPNGSIPVFPILMKEVFVDAVRDSNVPVMRCVFEADDELAALGRKLNCPVLSYDSDFYIFNVRYIPSITLTAKVHLGFYKEDIAKQPEKRLSKTQVRAIEKRARVQQILQEKKLTDKQQQQHRPSTNKNSKIRSYKYLDCCMYRVKNLIERGSLSKEKLPLFAALLGNDYIARSSFKEFFAVGMGRTGRSRKMRLQQRRIRLILQWLKNETADSALEKILTRLRKHQRESLKAQVYAATSGYSNEICHSYDFFKTKYPAYLEKCMIIAAGSADVGSDTEAESEEDDDTVEEEEEKDVIEEEEEVEDENEQFNKHVKAKITSGENVEQNYDNDQQDEEEDDELVVKEEIESEEQAEDEEEDDIVDKTKDFPTWFLDKLYPAHLSRFFVDLMHLRKYINSPQIEHFPYADCHEIALPILKYIFTLLHTVEGNECIKLNEDGIEIPIEFCYMTRAQKITNVCYHRHAIERPLPYSFVPQQPNPLLFRHIFQMPHLNSDLFVRINDVPKDLQLYMLAVVYWLQKSPHYDILHLHALIICLVVLRTIDKRIPVIRDQKSFSKHFGKIIKREREVRDKEALECGKRRGIRADLMTLPVQERIEHVTKSDCYLVQEQLLKHFHMQEIFKKKYDNFSTPVLHGFTEFQSIVFQINALNALLDFPYLAPKMGSCFSGVFLYNVHDALRARVDIEYYVQHNIFPDSPLMFDFYSFLLNWCFEFLPIWKKQQQVQSEVPVSKKVLKKRRLLNKKRAAKVAAESVQPNIVDPNADMLIGSADDDNTFYDLNNKFCTLLKVC